MPGSVRETPGELDTTSGKFGEKRVRILNEQVGVEEFVGIFIRIRRRRFGAAEVDSVLVTCDDSVHRRVLPSAETVEAKFILVIGQRRRDVHGEELGRNLVDHLVEYTTCRVATCHTS